MKNEDTREIDINEDDGITEIPDHASQRRAQIVKFNLARTASKVNVHRSRKGARLSPLAYGILAVLILLFVFIVADFSTGGFVYTANGKFVSLFAGGTSDDFSVSTDADNVFDFEAYANGYAILSENGISYVRKSGDISSSQNFTYSSPAMEISDSRVVVYDRGNTSYTLMQNESVYSQQAMDNKIIDFALSEKDNYAVAVRDENAKSILYGMDERGEIIYQWNCPNGYVTDIAITPNGNKVAVTVINSENAVLCSSIYILDFEYDSAYAQFDYKNETVLGAKFLSGTRVQVVTDKGVYRISGKEQETVFEYDSSDICYSDFSSKYTAVITKDYSNDDSYSLSLFSKSGKLRFTVALNGKVRGLSVSDKSVAVLFSDKTETYSNRGKLVGSVQNINHYDGVVLNGNYLYILSSDSVRRFPAYGDVSQVAEEDVTG